MEKRVKVLQEARRQRRSVCPDWLGAGGRCRCRCCCGRAGEMQLAAGRWARSYWVRWRNWQKISAGGGGGARGRWPLYHWPGGRTNCSSDAESKGAQLISRLSTLWGKFVPLPVRRAMLHYEFTRYLSVFSSQPITCRSSSDGDGNGDGDLAPKMLVHDTKPAKLNTKSGRLVLSLRTKMPPRRILEPSRAVAPPPCSSCYVLGCQNSTYRLENQLPSPLHNRCFCPDLHRRHHSAYGMVGRFLFTATSDVPNPWATA